MEELAMKGFNTSDGYMGLVGGKYILFAEGILYIAGILLMCWLFTQPVLLGILIVIGIVIAFASYRNKKEIE